MKLATFKNINSLNQRHCLLNLQQLAIGYLSQTFNIQQQLSGRYCEQSRLAYQHKQAYTQTGLAVRSSADSLQNRERNAKQREIDYYNELSKTWWDPNNKTQKGLQAMTPYRINLVREWYLESHKPPKASASKPLNGVRVADIGCGAGYLSEGFARLGAQVIGVDMSEGQIKAAIQHKENDKEIVNSIDYRHGSSFDLTNEQKFDLVVASEVIEHVESHSDFFKSLKQILKDDGGMFITTFNKTPTSYFIGIIMAEYVIRAIPQGTHDYKYFISFEDMIKLGNQNNMDLTHVTGNWYNPISNIWSKTSSKNFHISYFYEPRKS